jgi:hypothetical protein
MHPESTTHVAQEVAVPARTRARTGKRYRWVGLLAAVVVTTASWLLLLLLASHAFGFAVSLLFAIGFGVAIAAVSFVVATIVTAN